MKELIITLFENENFTLYLGIVIFLLILAFFIVLIIGKKDQKEIEKTKQLQTLQMEQSQNAAPNNEENPNITNEQNVLNNVSPQKVEYPNVEPPRIEQTNASPVAMPTVEPNVEMQTPVMPEAPVVMPQEPVLPVEPAMPDVPTIPEVQAPEPASVQAPEPASVQAPEPASVQAPEPASVQVPEPALESNSIQMPEMPTPPIVDAQPDVLNQELDNNTIVEAPKVMPEAPIAPAVEPVVEPVPAVMSEAPSFEQSPPSSSVYEVKEEIAPQPLVETPEENLDLKTEELFNNLNNLSASISNELDSLENAKKEFINNSNQTTFVEEKVPEISNEMPELPKKPFRPTQVFSSVYAPPSNTFSSEYDDEEEMEMELPRLK